MLDVVVGHQVLIGPGIVTLIRQIPAVLCSTLGL